MAYFLKTTIQVRDTNAGTDADSVLMFGYLMDEKPTAAEALADLPEVLERLPETAATFAEDARKRGIDI